MAGIGLIEENTEVVAEAGNFATNILDCGIRFIGIGPQQPVLLHLFIFLPYLPQWYELVRLNVRSAGNMPIRLRIVHCLI